VVDHSDCRRRFYSLASAIEKVRLPNFVLDRETMKLDLEADRSCCGSGYMCLPRWTPDTGRWVLCTPCAIFNRIWCWTGSQCNVRSAELRWIYGDRSKLKDESCSGVLYALERNDGRSRPVVHSESCNSRVPSPLETCDVSAVSASDGGRTGAGDFVIVIVLVCRQFTDQQHRGHDSRSLGCTSTKSTVMHWPTICNFTQSILQL